MNGSARLSRRTQTRLIADRLMAELIARRDDKCFLHRRILGDIIRGLIMRITEFAQLVAERKIQGSLVVTLSIVEAELLLRDLMFAFGSPELPRGQSFIED